MTTSLKTLAILGGTPAFNEILHVGQPNLGSRKRLLEYVNRIFDSRQLTNNGPYVKEFEQRLSELLGVRHCVAMCNATTALGITIRALGLTGEVIIPSFTFVATAHALQWHGITPIFCDIDPVTHCIDAQRIEKLITPRTSGILGVHLWGNPCDMDAMTDIAGRHNLKLVFDAAHAFACSLNERMIGGFGEAEVFSFHATKFFNTLEGGVVATNNDELARKVGRMKDFGFTALDEVSMLGINGKMNEISAAVGLVNLESLEDLIATQRDNYQQYQEELTDLEGISLLKYDERGKRNYQYIVIEVDDSSTLISRDELMEVLHAENVLARRYFYPGCHRMEPYRSLYPNASALLPQTERIAARVLTLPTGQAITHEKIMTICEIIRSALENGAEIQKVLRERGVS